MSIQHAAVVIFRMTAADDTEATLTDKVEFDGGTIPDARAGIEGFEPEMLRTRTENSAPFLQTARKPDTGYQGTTYQLRAFFNETTGRALGIAKFRDWLREDNAIPGVFRDGRFGIRNDYRPELNLTPTKTAGYKLNRFYFPKDMLYPAFTSAIIELEFSGDPSRLGI